MKPHLPSSQNLIQDLLQLPSKTLKNGSVFISLDVVNLYPSVPVNLAIEVISEFSKTHWCEIDNLGICVEQFLKMLKFVSYNYEIQFNEKVYLQVKGCPMGSHYAPPFAIIFMNYIEQQALNILEARLGIDTSEFLYKRYIDDIIFGPFDKNEKLFGDILSIFNSVNENITFTLEIPKSNRLNFLDLTIWVENEKIFFKNYKKDICSINTLKKNSWLPNSVKTNFLKNSFLNIETHCSSSLPEEDLHDAITQCGQKLRLNGYSDADINRGWMKKKTKNRNISSFRKSNPSFLKLPFISDSLIRKINFLIRKYNFNVQLLSTGNKNLRHIFNSKIEQKSMITV